MKRCRDLRGAGQLAWRNLGRILASADMAYTDLVCLRFYLAEAAHDPANVAILNAHFGEHPQQTVICAQLLEPEWLIEVEAVAARPV